jgi:fluoroquinolone resistance protein
MKQLPQGTQEYYSHHFTAIEGNGEQLTHLEFEDCTFIKCDFSDGEIRECRFINCSFIDCNMSNVKVARSKFMEVSFERCKMVGIDWSRAYWPSVASFEAVKFSACLISYSSFYGLELQEIIIQECKALEVDFREGNFSGSDFSHTNFGGSLFSKTNLKKVNFEEATDYQIDVLNNDIQGAKFSRYEAVNLLQGLGIELLD